MGAAPKAGLEKSVCHLARLSMVLALAATVMPPIGAQPAPEAKELRSYDDEQRSWGLGSQVKELGAPLGASDERGRERFLWQCQNELGRREVTLFGNGTVRLRSGLWENPQLHLDELGPDELHAYLERLSTIQRSRSFPQIAERLTDFQGLWNQTCELHLELPDLPIRQLKFDHLATPALEIGQMVQIADELASFTRVTRAGERLPRGYKPRAGDVLRNSKGYLYRVVGLTTGDVGVELEALGQPLRVFYALVDLDDNFVAVETESGYGTDRPWLNFQVREARPPDPLAGDGLLILDPDSTFAGMERSAVEDDEKDQRP